MIRFTLFSLICLSIVGFFQPTFAFEQEEESPILALNRRVERFGGFVGIGGLWQSGEFGVDCNCNTFRDGGGTQISLGGLYEVFLSNSVVFGSQLGYQNRNLDARYTLTDATTLKSLDGKSTFTNVPVTFRHKAYINFNSLFVKPYVKWMPLKPKIFGRLGLEAALTLSSSKEFHKVLLTNSVVLSNDDVVAVVLDRAAIEASGLSMVSDNEVIVQKGSMANSSSLILALCPAIGAELRVSKKLLVVPVLEYSMPLSALSSVDTSFKTNALQFFIEMHYELK